VGALAAVEAKLLAKGHAPSNQPRPWFSRPVPPLADSVDVSVEFPSDEEETGCVMVAWRAAPWRQFKEVTALHVLHTYLTESEVSLLHREFVEGGEAGEPLCSALSCGLIENSETFQFCCFDAVAADKIDEVKPRLIQVLEGLCETGIDMDRMASVLARFEAKHLNALEDNPHDTLSHYLIQTFLFAQAPADAEQKLSTMFQASALCSLSSADWVAMVRSFFLTPPSVCVRATPSASRAAALQKSEQERIEQRTVALGPEKLGELAQKLDEANEQNNTPVPDGMVQQFEVPQVSSITFIPVASAFYPPVEKDGGSKRGPADAELQSTLDSLCPSHPPFYLQVDHVRSDFIEIRVVLNTDPLPPRLKLYLELYLEAAYSLPTVRDGAVVPYEQLVQELQDQTVGYGNSLGVGGGNFVCGAFSQVAIFSMKVRNTQGHYLEAISLLRDVLVNSTFEAERLRVAAKNLLADVSEMKREGEVICQALLRERMYGEGSNHHACNLIRQHRFLSATLEALGEEDGCARVLSELSGLRAILTDPSNLFCQVVADAYKLGDVKSGWLTPNFLRAEAGSAGPRCPADVSYARAFHKECVGSPGAVASVLSMAAIESSFLFAACKGLPGFGHEDTAPMLVAIELLCSIEGPMWREVRGLGLAYSFGMHGDADEGLVYFSLSRSSNVPKAFQAAKKLVGAFASGEEAMESVTVENAIASVVSAVVSREQTVSACGMQSIMSALRASGPGHNSRLVQAVLAVTEADLQRVLSRYLVNVFEPSKANLAITTNGNKVEEVVSGLEGLGWKPDRLDSVDDFVK